MNAPDIAYPISKALQLVQALLLEDATGWTSSEGWPTANGGATCTKIIGPLTLTLDRGSFIVRGKLGAADPQGIVLKDYLYERDPAYVAARDEFEKQVRDAKCEAQLAALNEILQAHQDED